MQGEAPTITLLLEYPVWIEEGIASQNSGVSYCERGQKIGYV